MGSPLELADKDPLSPEVPAIPFDEAIKFLKARVPLTKSEWLALEPELRYRAFTVAALSTHDNVEQARQMAIKSLEKGTPLGEFWTEASLLNSTGLGASPWYWENVYRTNIQTAYNAGRAAEFSRTQPEYLEFIGIEDSRQTEICAMRSGTILPATHPFWKANWPPLHFGCRSTVRSVYVEEVELLREMNPNWDPTADARITRDPPPSGWGANPIESRSFYKLTPAMKERADRYGILTDIKALAKDLGLENIELGIPIQAVQDLSFTSIKDPCLRKLAVEAFKTAPQEVRAIVAKNQDVFTVKIASGNRSFYEPYREAINIRPGSSPEVFAHEFGHGMDFKVGAIYSSTEPFRAAFQSDLDTLISPSSNRVLARGRKLSENLIEKGWNNIASVSDLFDGLTKGRIKGRWGHSAQYWKRDGAREMEVFADLFALRSSGEEQLWNEVKAFVPNLCEAIDRFIAEQ